MKKILILLSILLVIGTACSSGPTKQAQGKWKMENGEVTLTIKGEKFKANFEGTTMEGSIKDDEKHKDLSIMKLPEEKLYVKVNGDTLTLIEEPGDNLDEGDQYKKVK